MVIDELKKEIEQKDIIISQLIKECEEKNAKIEELELNMSQLKILYKM